MIVKVKLNKSFSFRIPVELLKKSGFNLKELSEVFIRENSDNLVEIYEHDCWPETVEAAIRKEKDGSILVYIPDEFKEHYIFEHHPQIIISLQDDHILVKSGKKFAREELY